MSQAWRSQLEHLPDLPFKRNWYMLTNVGLKGIAKGGDGGETHIDIERDLLHGSSFQTKP